MSIIAFMYYSKNIDNRRDGYNEACRGPCHGDHCASSRAQISPPPINYTRSIIGAEREVKGEIVPSKSEIVQNYLLFLVEIA